MFAFLTFFLLRIFFVVFRYIYEYVFVEYLQQYREHSTAQHSAAHPAQSSKRSTRRSQYISKKVPGMYVRTCMEHGCFPGAWNSWHLQVACLNLKCWTIYYVCLFVLFFLVSERSRRNRPLREAPCIQHNIRPYVRRCTAG